MSIREQVAEIMTANQTRTNNMFRDVARRAKIYKKAHNIWSFETVEERALEALLEQALTEHLIEKGARQTLVTHEFYTIVVSGRPHSGGVSIRILHPLSEPTTLGESYDTIQKMIDSAFDGS
jgi:hypothetical protein